jgi:hypothetical protein
MSKILELIAYDFFKKWCFVYFEGIRLIQNSVARRFTAGPVHKL